MVSEEDAAAIRAAFEQGGEFSAAIELRRRFPLIADNDQARQHARTIAIWRQPLKTDNKADGLAAPPGRPPRKRRT